MLQSMLFILEWIYYWIDNLTEGKKILQSWLKSFVISFFLADNDIYWTSNHPIQKSEESESAICTVRWYDFVQQKKISVMAKLIQFLSFLVWLIRCFLYPWVYLGFRLIYGNQKFRLPPITNQLLLQPATVIAKRIRTREVS